MRRMYSKAQLLEAIQEEASLNGIKVFEDVVDKDDHKRFIEGNLDTPEKAGFTFNYAKWSLSGSHLLIVLAFSIASGTSHTASAVASVTLPTWIHNKISPIVNNRVSALVYNLYKTDLTGSQVTGWLNKESTRLDMTLSSLTTESDLYCRIQIDLLIDNDNI